MVTCNWSEFYNTATVISTPTASITYTVVGTIGTCTASTTVPVILYPATTVTATADVTTGCSPLSTTLHAVSTSSWSSSLYSFSGSPGTFTPITGTTVTLATGDDGHTGNLPIGFSFAYNGTTFTVFRYLLTMDH
ncbi:MAG: hypothetical protein IPL24_05420 [Bacteroidetes bacterium]|nr:hypothetical protein [Bacteroidota bacterium]